MRRHLVTPFLRSATRDNVLPLITSAPTFRLALNGCFRCPGRLAFYLGITARPCLEISLNLWEQLHGSLFGMINAKFICTEVISQWLSGFIITTDDQYISCCHNSSSVEHIFPIFRLPHIHCDTYELMHSRIESLAIIIVISNPVTLCALLSCTRHQVSGYSISIVTGSSSRINDDTHWAKDLL